MNNYKIVRDIKPNYATTWEEKNNIKTIKCLCQDESNVLLGQVCGLLALVHSGRLYKDGEGAISQVTGQLLQLSKKKAQLHQLCASGIAEIISKVRQEDIDLGVELFIFINSTGISKIISKIFRHLSDHVIINPYIFYVFILL